MDKLIQKDLLKRLVSEYSKAQLEIDNLIEPLLDNILAAYNAKHNCGIPYLSFAFVEEGCVVLQREMGDNIYFTVDQLIDFAYSDPDELAMETLLYKQEKDMNKSIIEEEKARAKYLKLKERFGE